MHLMLMPPLITPECMIKISMNMSHCDKQPWTETVFIYKCPAHGKQAKRFDHVNYKIVNSH